MRHVWQTLSLLPTLFVTCFALHESDVGVVDWHKSLIGAPLVDSAVTSPRFHRVGGKNTQSVVISATESNVLAGLTPVNGSVVWRYVFEPEDPIISFNKYGWVVTSLSGPGGSNLRLFNSVNGDLLLEKQLHKPESGFIAEPRHLGCSVGFGNETLGTPDLFVLSNGNTVQNIVGREVKWKWVSEDQSSLVIYTNVLVTSQSIYVIGLSKSLASHTLHVTSLSPATGAVIASIPIPSSVHNGIEDLHSVFSSLGEPHMLWLESNTLKHFALSPELTGKPVSHRGAAFRQIIDLGLGLNGVVVGIKVDGTGQALRLKSRSEGVKMLWEFEASAPSERHSKSMYAGGWDKEGRPYVGRLYWSYSIGMASAELFAPHLADGKGLISGFSFPFDTNQHGTISHFAMDTANPSMFQVIGRLVITTSTGAVQLWQHDKLQWTREESLADVSLAEFVELPEKVLAATAIHAERGEGYSKRLGRHIKDAKDLPNYLVHFIKRFATGSYESATSSALPTKDSGSLHRDAFGFRQIIVVATSRGKIFGLDSSNGEIVWRKLLSHGAMPTGTTVRSVKMFVVKAVGDDSTGLEESAKASSDGPEVVIVAQRGSDKTGVEMVLYHFNALSGEDVKSPKPNSPLSGVRIASGAVTDSYLLKSPEGKVVIIVDGNLNVHLYPDTATSESIFAAALPSLSAPLRTSATHLGSHQVVGHQFTKDEGSVGYSALSTWSFTLPEGEDIQSIIPPTRGPVASIGKVLGNRTTLYKYLNEHMFIVLTAPHSSQTASSKTKSGTSGCGVYLVDGVKGSVLYHASVPSMKDGGCDVKAVLTENWLVYHYYDDDYHGRDQAKGYRVVSVELYEGKKVDEKFESSDLTSYSEQNLDITAYEQSFVYPRGITALAATSTKYGITSKDIIVADSNNKISSLSRRLLDPRRPKRKPTTEEMEELLVQYDPLLPDDPRKVLSHNYEVMRIQHIITTPALLESTSIVFAYGLDLFLSRVAPSKTFDVLNESFNKTQLVLTVLGLLVAILFARPVVRRKKLRERWYQ